MSEDLLRHFGLTVEDLEKMGITRDEFSKYGAIYVRVVRCGNQDNMLGFLARHLADIPHMFPPEEAEQVYDLIGFIVKLIKVVWVATFNGKDEVMSIKMTTPKMTTPIV